MTDILLANGNNPSSSTLPASGHKAVNAGVAGISADPDTAADKSDQLNNSFSSLLEADTSDAAGAGSDTNEEESATQTLPENGNKLPLFTKYDAPVTSPFRHELNSNVDPETILHPATAPVTPRSDAGISDAPVHTAKNTVETLPGVRPQQLQQESMAHIGTVVSDYQGVSGSPSEPVNTPILKGIRELTGQTEQKISTSTMSADGRTVGDAATILKQDSSPAVNPVAGQVSASSQSSELSDAQTRPSKDAAADNGTKDKAPPASLLASKGTELNAGQQAETSDISLPGATKPLSVETSSPGRSGVSQVLQENLEPDSAVATRVTDTSTADAMNTRMAHVLAADKAGLAVSRVHQPVNVNVSDAVASDEVLRDKPDLSQSQTAVTREISGELQTQLRMMQPDKLGTASRSSTMTSNGPMHNPVDQVMTTSDVTAMERRDVTAFNQSIRSVELMTSQRPADEQMMSAILAQVNTQSPHAMTASPGPSLTPVPIGMEALVQANPLQPILNMTATGGVLQGAITETFARPNWSEGMAKQVMMMVDQNINRAELRLNPANLGTIEVRIEVTDDQVNVAMNSRHVAVRDAMEQALPRLREMFEDSGLSLADTDISEQSFSEQRQDDSDANAIRHPVSQHDIDDVVLPDEHIIQNVTLSDTLVDYYT